jgi:hypothetical protein
MKTRTLLAGLVALAAWSWAPAGASAQTYEYAVKVVCGVPDSLQLAQGRYFTAINVHNPQRDGTELRFKVALTGPLLSEGSVSGFSAERLRADRALEIDCPQVRRRFLTSPPMMSGFVVIQSPVELDVVAVYTVGATGTRNAITMDVERVMPRTFQE